LPAQHSDFTVQLEVFGAEEVHRNICLGVDGGAGRDLHALEGVMARAVTIVRDQVLAIGFVMYHGRAADDLVGLKPGRLFTRTGGETVVASDAGTERQTLYRIQSGHVSGRYREQRGQVGFHREDEVGLELSVPQGHVQARPLVHEGRTTDHVPATGDEVARVGSGTQQVLTKVLRILVVLVGEVTDLQAGRGVFEITPRVDALRLGNTRAELGLQRQW